MAPAKEPIFKIKPRFLSNCLRTIILGFRVGKAPLNHAGKDSICNAKSCIYIDRDDIGHFFLWSIDEVHRHGMRFSNIVHCLRILEQ